MIETIRGLKGAFVLVRKTCCHLLAHCSLLFGSHELGAKTLAEGATSPADPSISEEAWFRLKTWFVWVHPFNQGPSVHLVIASETCDPLKEDSCSSHRQFQPNKPVGHRFFAI
jgi:hypothetical protein